MIARVVVIGFMLVFMPAMLLSRVESQAATQKVVAAPTPCRVEAYVIDPDPKGLNVRFGPGTEFGVKTRLLAQNETMVSIKGASGSWLMIDEAFEVEAVEESKGLQGKGWVYASMLALTTRYVGLKKEPAVPLFQEPNHNSPVVLRLPRDLEVKIVGCRGDWVQVQYKTYKGWLDAESQCGNPVTNCS
jgi:SH3-like domain-containing protein